MRKEPSVLIGFSGLPDFEMIGFIGATLLDHCYGCITICSFLRPFAQHKKAAQLEQLKALINQGADVNMAIGFDRMALEGGHGRTFVAPN